MLRATLATVLLFVTIMAQQGDTARQNRVDTNHSTIGFSVPIMGAYLKSTANLQTLPSPSIYSFLPAAVLKDSVVAESITYRGAS